MERKIGETFDYLGTTLKVVRWDKCANCAFYHDDCINSSIREIRGVCEETSRKDHIPAMFVKVDNPSTPLISIKKKSIILNFK